jgi:TRAP-type C4-dicarboxylate transport system permease small subunit
MRKMLTLLYDGAGAFAALFMIGCLLMVLASVAGRMLNFHLRGADAYAGYCMAAAGFLALAHTLKRGEHIRVTLILERLGIRGKHVLEIIAHAIGAFFSGAFAWFSVRLAYQSYAFNDISQGNDATPLWIPQIGMAVGAIILFVAIFDEFVLHLTHRHQVMQPGELKLME